MIIEWRTVQLRLPVLRFRRIRQFSLLLLLVVVSLVASTTFALFPPAKQGLATIALTPHAQFVQSEDYAHVRRALLTSPFVVNSALRRLPRVEWPRELRKSKQHQWWFDDHLAVAKNGQGDLVVTLTSSKSSRLQLQKLTDAICDAFVYEVFVLESINNAVANPSQKPRWLKEAQRRVEFIRMPSIRDEAEALIESHSS